MSRIPWINLEIRFPTDEELSEVNTREVAAGHEPAETGCVFEVTDADGTKRQLILAHRNLRDLSDAFNLHLRPRACEECISMGSKLDGFLGISLSQCAICKRGFMTSMTIEVPPHMREDIIAESK